MCNSSCSVRIESDILLFYYDYSTAKINRVVIKN